MRKTLIWILMLAIFVNMAAVKAYDYYPNGNVNLVGKWNITNASIVETTCLNLNGTIMCSINGTGTGGNMSFNQSLTDRLYLHNNSNVNMGVYNLTANNLLGYINWSWIQNAPVYMSDWSAEIIGNSTADRAYTDLMVRNNWTDLENRKLNKTGGTISGNLIVTQTLTVLGSFIVANVTSQSVNGSIYPTLNNIFDLGLANSSWANIYVNTVNASNIYANGILVNTFLYNQTTPAIAYANANFYNKSANVDTGVYNVTSSWFKGLFNWISSDNWNSFNGSALAFNETKLNNSINVAINYTNQSIIGLNNATIARIGNCTGGQVVQNTTTNGVQCAQISIINASYVTYDNISKQSVNYSQYVNLSNVPVINNSYVTYANISNQAVNYSQYVNLSNVPIINSSYVTYANISNQAVNYSNYGNYSYYSNLSNYINSSGVLNPIWVNKSGDTMTGNLVTQNLTAQNITATGSLYAGSPTQSSIINGALRVNGTVTLTEDNGNFPQNYYKGYPIAGELGSGIIWAKSLSNRGSLNVNYTGMSVTYPAFTVRLVYTNGSSTNCNMPQGTVTAPYSAHTVYYIDHSCNIQTESMSQLAMEDLSPDGTADFMNVMADSVGIEVLKGTSIQSVVEKKLRELTLRDGTGHLSVIDGMQINTGAWRNFSISSGDYQYIREIVPTTLQNLSKGANLEFVSHLNSTTYQYVTQHQLNLTSCDNGTATITCSPNNQWRRYFLFMVGYNGTTDTSEIHQLAASNTITYTSAANCLDTTITPLTYSLPSEYQYAAVKLYAYCGRANDNAWVTTQFIDMRTVKTGTATTQTETDPVWSADKPSYSTTSDANSLYVFKTGDNITGNINMTGNNITNINYLNPSGSMISVGGNFNMTGKNITGIDWLIGKINWSNIQNVPSLGQTYYSDEIYINKNSSNSFNLNETKLNKTIVSLANVSKYLPLTGGVLTGNITTSGNITSDWLFGKLDYSNIQNPPNFTEYAGTKEFIPLWTDAGLTNSIMSQSISGYYTIFVTNDTYTGDLGGLDGADAKCQALATEAGLDGTYKAWLSNETVNAEDRLTHGTSHYVLVDGTLVANNWADLTDGTLLHAINLDQKGNPRASFVWTGTDYTGVLSYYQGNPSDCVDWTLGTYPGGQGGYGSSGSTSAYWTDYSTMLGALGCDEKLPIYCISQSSPLVAETWVDVNGGINVKDFTGSATSISWKNSTGDAVWQTHMIGNSLVDEYLG